MSSFLKYSITEIKDFLETKVFFAFAIFFSVNFILISQFAKWTETELYPVHHSKYLFSAFSHEFLFSLKPLFYSLLKISFLFSKWLPVEPMELSRFFFSLNGLVLLSFLYLYLKEKTDRYNAILAVLVLISSYIFLNRGFRVRSDLLSSSLSFFILWMSLNWKDEKKQPVFLFLFLCLLFITPKAIYWILLNFLLLEKKSRLALFKKLSLKLILILVGFFIGVSILFKDPLFIKSFYETGKFYILSAKISYSPLLEKGLIESFPSMLLSTFIDKNYFFLFLIALKVFFMFHYWIDSKKLDQGNLFFLVLFAITFLHPDPKLVFFSALSPFFIVAFFTDSIWLKLINPFYSLKFKVILLGGFFLYGFSYIGYFSYKTITQKNNLTQKKIIEHLNDFYKDTPPEWNILDPSCMIHSRKTTCKYLLYQEGFDQTKYIKKIDFDMILSSQSLALFDLLTDHESKIQYVSVKNHILYKAFVIDKESYEDLKQEETEDFNEKINFNQTTNFKKSEDTNLDQITKLSENMRLTQNISFNQNINSDTKKEKNRNLNSNINSHSKINLVENSKINQNLDPTKNLDQKTVTEEEIIFLSGDKIMDELFKMIEKDSLKGTYFYTYIDSLNRTNLTKTLSSKKSALLPLKNYSEKEWRKSLIPITEERIAVFYFAFPMDLNEEISLRILLRYEKW